MVNLGNVVTDVIDNTRQSVELTEQQRRALEIECDAYDADVSTAKVELVKLTTLMPSPGTEQDPKTRAAMYWDILKLELSPENISRVCRSAMVGRVSNRPFLPLPSELISYANTYFQRRDPVRKDPRLPQPKGEQLRLAAPEHRLLTKADDISGNDVRKQAAHQLRNLAAQIGNGNEMLDQISGKPKSPIDYATPIVVSGSLKPHIDKIKHDIVALKEEFVDGG